MDAQLIIFSYPPDLLWLDYCLRSVKKYWHSGHAPLLIVTPECKSHMPPISEGCRIIYEPQWPDHHAGQIYAKMNVDHYTDEPMVIITDSDCLFTRSCETADFCNAGRPIIHMEAYASLIPRSIMPDQNCFHHYKEIIGTILHILPEHEYMRRHPFIYHRDHIRDVRERIESKMNMPLADVMKPYHSGYFSEFNIFGAYCRHCHRDLYYWQDIWSAPEPIVHQFHSHSENPQAGVAAEQVAKILS